MTSPMMPTVEDGTPRDHLGFPLSPRRGSKIPEDDGMSALRARIQEIHARDVSPMEKAKLMHQLMLEGHRASRIVLPTSSNEGFAVSVAQTREEATSQGPLESLMFWQSPDGESRPEKFVLTQNDLTPCYAPMRRNKSQSGLNTPSAQADPNAGMLHPPLGCQHYQRNVKLQCFDCNKWYPCRFCHDEAPGQDHKLPRFQTRYMLCMLCWTPQRASDCCAACQQPSAYYYCDICKLWENRQSKPIYHCYDCGICRKGLGLGKDFFHCQKCSACIPTSIETSHRCIERSTDCDCPICGEYMFTSPKPVVFMVCGHSIHKKCYDQHMMVSYKCPICSKSLANMETQFRNLDLAIQSQPMPEEYNGTMAIISCNDCSGRSMVPYHYLGTKCNTCRSYNTRQLRLLGNNSQELQAALDEQNAQGANGQAAAPLASRSREGSIAGRRRHSSQGVEIQRRASDIIAGSYPPLNMRYGPGPGMEQIDSEDEEPNDGIFGFWSRSRGSNDEDDYVSDDESSDADEDDDDDEDENGIVLIGHR